MEPIDVLLEIFDDLNVKLKKTNHYYQCRAFWRDGTDETSVAIYPNKNLVKDFVENKTYKINTLLKKILGIKTDEEFDVWLEEKQYNIRFDDDTTYIPSVELPKVFPKSDLSAIDTSNQEYLLGRGISLDIAQQLRGGVVSSGKMKDRYTWPIFNSKGNIVGFTGRTLKNHKNKYKHLGDKQKWVWPAFVNGQDIISAGSIILVESPMDVASLMTAGIRNCVNLNGSELSLGVLNFLIKLNIKKIIISTNNDDESNNYAGQQAAKRIYNSLTRHFNQNQVFIFLPPKYKDWNEILVKKGPEYVNKLWNGKVNIIK